MKAGKLDRKIEIMGATVTRDEYGGESKSWSVLARVPAEFKPLTARERFASDAIRTEREGRFLVRYLTGIDQTMRINFDSTVWEITGIAEIGRREGLEISAKVTK
jgi:SPP1 family predicted phage head-tail adaptor